MKINYLQSNVTEKLNIVLKNSLFKCIDENNDEMYKIYYTSLQNTLIKAVNYYAYSDYCTLLFYFVDIYKYLKSKNLNSERHIYSMYTTLFELLNYYIRATFSRSLSPEQRYGLFQFIYFTYEVINTLFYEMIRNVDKIGFGAAMKIYNELGLMRNIFFTDRVVIPMDEKKDLNLKYSNLYIDLLNGLQVWLWLLFDKKKIDEEILSEFTKEINLIRIKPEHYLNKVFYVMQSENNFYLGWKNWDYAIRKPFTAYTIVEPMDWLPLGFIIYSIKSSSFNLDINDLNPDYRRYIKYFYSNIEHYSTTLIDDYDKWKLVLNNISKDALVTKINEIKKKLEDIF